MSETDEERGGLENTVAFTKAAGKGAYAAGEGIVTGFWALGKAAASAGEELVTSPEYREDLWNKTIEAADAASDYASGVAEDPQKLVNDVSDGIDRVRDAVSEAYADYKRAEAEAIAEGRAAEFYGNIAGHGLVEVGSTVVPVGAAAKLSKVSKFAKAVDKAEDLADAVPGGPLSGKQKARLAEEANKGVPDTPCAAAATTKCPKEISNKGNGTNIDWIKEHNTTAIFNQKKGILGGHNENIFKASLESNGGRITSIIENPSMPGVKSIYYEIPSKDSAGNIVPGVYKTIKDPKTVYDPNILSDQNVAEMSAKAAQKVEFEDQERAAFSTVNGYSFRVYRDLETGNVTNSHLRLPK